MEVIQAAKLGRQAFTYPSPAIFCHETSLNGACNKYEPVPKGLNLIHTRDDNNIKVINSDGLFAAGSSAEVLSVRLVAVMWCKV